MITSVSLKNDTIDKIDFCMKAGIGSNISHFVRIAVDFYHANLIQPNKHQAPETIDYTKIKELINESVAANISKISDEIKISIERQQANILPTVIQEPTEKPPRKPRKVKQREKDIPESVDEVIDYYKKNNSINPEELGAKFWKYYSAGQWADKDGKPVLNWKQKAITFESTSNSYGNNTYQKKNKDFVISANGQLIVDYYTQEFILLNNRSPLISKEDMVAANELADYLLAESTLEQDKALLSIKIILRNQAMWGKMYKSKNNLAHIHKHFNTIVENIKQLRTYVSAQIEQKRVFLRQPDFNPSQNDVNKWVDEFENQK
jgi:hypothetical protein